MLRDTNYWRGTRICFRVSILPLTSFENSGQTGYNISVLLDSRLGLGFLMRNLFFMRPFPLPQEINHTLFRRNCLKQSLSDPLLSPPVITKYNRNFSNKTDAGKRCFVSRRLDNSVTLYLMIIITICLLLASKPFGVSDTEFRQASQPPVPLGK